MVINTTRYESCNVKIIIMIIFINQIYEWPQAAVYCYSFYTNYKNSIYARTHSKMCVRKNVRKMRICVKVVSSFLFCYFFSSFFLLFAKLFFFLHFSRWATWHRHIFFVFDIVYMPFGIWCAYHCVCIFGIRKKWFFAHLMYFCAPRCIANIRLWLCETVFCDLFFHYYKFSSSSTLCKANQQQQNYEYYYYYFWPMLVRLETTLLFMTLR